MTHKENNQHRKHILPIIFPFCLHKICPNSHRLSLESALEPPVKELSRVLPLDDIPDTLLLLHSPCRIVQIGKLERDLVVHWQEHLFPGLDLCLDLCPLLLRALGVGERLLEPPVHFIKPLHCIEQRGLPVLDLDGALWLEDAAARLRVGVHLHKLGVDGRVEHDPRAAAQLGVRRKVHKQGLLVLAKRVDNVRAKLEDLVKHVALAAGKAAPVGKDEEGELLALVKVADRLCSLEGRVGVPNLAGHLRHLLLGVVVGGVGGGDLLDSARLDGNDAEGDAAEAGAAGNNRLGPAAKGMGVSKKEGKSRVVKMILKVTN